MLRNPIIAMVALLTLVACSNRPQQQSDPITAFTSVQTIELRDGTDPLILASTNSARVREYLEIGLKHRGYSVCSGCTADAVATVKVNEYSTRQVMKRNWLGNLELNVVNEAVSDWTFTVVQDRDTVLQRRISHRDTVAIDRLAARQVQQVLVLIPPRK